MSSTSVYTGRAFRKQVAFSLLTFGRVLGRQGRLDYVYSPYSFLGQWPMSSLFFSQQPDNTSVDGAP